MLAVPALPRRHTVLVEPVGHGIGRHANRRTAADQARDIPRACNSDSLRRSTSTYSRSYVLQSARPAASGPWLNSLISPTSLQLLMRPILHVPFLAMIVIGGGLACAAPAQTSSPSFTATVNTEDGSVGVFLADGILSLYTVDSNGHFQLVTSKTESGGIASVHLSAYGGQTADKYNSFVFGIAPPDAGSFVLSQPGQAVGGDVSQGAYVVAVTQTDVTPDELHWKFLRPDGSVLEEGTGITE